MQKITVFGGRYKKNLSKLKDKNLPCLDSRLSFDQIKEFFFQNDTLANYQDVVTYVK